MDFGDHQGVGHDLGIGMASKAGSTGVISRVTGIPTRVRPKARPSAGIKKAPIDAVEGVC